MDFEAPVDAWYVWVGVAVVSVALVGVVLSLPTQAPPDADRAANTIDRVGGSTYQAEANYEHDADEVRVTTGQISMRNDGGTDHASTRFESVTPIHTVTDAVEDADEVRDALEQVLHGTNPDEVVNATDVETHELVEAVSKTSEYVASDSADWQPATGALVVRQVRVGNETVVLVDV